MADRAQSELVGFALVFGILILSILVLTITGFAGLESAQEHQRTTNVEPAFELFGADVEDLTHRGATTRTTEIKLADNSLSLEETVELTVNGETTPITGLVFDSNTGTQLRYESGLISRSDGGDSVRLRSPSFTVSEEAIIVSVVTLTATDAEAVGGSGTVLVESNHVETQTHRFSAEEVDFEVVGDHTEPWIAYFDEIARTTPACSFDSELSCDAQVVYLVVDTVEIRFR